MDGSLHRTVILPESLAPAATNLTSGGNIIVVGVNPATVLQLRQYLVAEGEFFTEGDIQCDRHLANLCWKVEQEAGRHPDPAIRNRDHAIPHRGTADHLPVPNPEEVYIPLTDAQAMFNLPGQVNRIEGTIKTDAVLDDVVARLANRAGRGHEHQCRRSPEPSSLPRIEVGKSAFFIFGVLALVMGAFVIYNTFRTVVVERRHDIGMLRALGASRGTIRGLFLIETLIQGIGGSVLGILGGYLPGFVLHPDDQHLRPGDCCISTSDSRWSKLSNLVISLAIGIGFTVASGLLPAMAASQVTPLEALRPDSAVTQKRTMNRRAIAGLVAARPWALPVC